MKRLYTKQLFCILILVAATAGCGGGGGGGLSGEFPSVNTTGSVSGKLLTPSTAGRVTNATVTLVPLVDAVVTCSGRQATTDSNGEFEVTLVPTGTIKCQAVKSGYNLIEFTVSVLSGKKTSLPENIPVYVKGDFLVTTSITLTSGSTSDSYPVSCSVVGGRADKIAIACDSSLDYFTVAINASTGSKNCMYTVPGTFTPVCSVNSSVEDESDSSITVTGSSSVSVVASINPVTGTFNEYYQLSCLVSGNIMLSLEGRCESTDNWTLIPSGSTLTCQYDAAGTYTPSCRVDESLIDNADIPVVVINPSLSVVSSISPSSSMNYSSYKVTCTSKAVPTALEGKCDVDDAIWTPLGTNELSTKILSMQCAYLSTSSYNPICRLNGTDTASVIPEVYGLTIDSFVQTCTANGTPTSMEGSCKSPATATDTVTWSVMNPVNRVGTLDCSYASAGSYAPICRANEGTSSTVSYTMNIVEPVPPKVNLFSPKNKATDVPDDAPSFSVIFSVENNGSMDASINLNTQATLTASGFTITIQRNDTGNSLTIDTTNALSYGSFSWERTFADNDTLKYTLKTNAQLTSAGLKTIASGKRYNITAFNVPTNLTDSRGVALDRVTKVPTTGYFTTIISDKTAPKVSAFIPADGAIDVPFDGPVFSIKFNESMQSSVDLNNAATLTASGFSTTIQRNDTGASITIDASNALSYGTFSWGTTSVSNDTLSFTVFADSVLAGSGLTRFATGTLYNITARTVPVNLTDTSSNALDTVTNIPLTGSFTTLIPDVIAPQVNSFLPADGAIDVNFDGPVFSVIFNESMDSSINLNSAPTLTASGFSISLLRVDSGGTITIDSTNALDYGVFSWGTTNVADDTLLFTVKAHSVLVTNGLSRFAPSTLYNITAMTVPVNLTDTSSNALDTVTNIPATGSFTTLP